VSKVYATSLFGRRGIQALTKINLHIRQGEVFGLLGPNRAGKTTLAKLLLSLSRPSGGRILRLGAPVTDRRTLARVGYMHENHAFPRYLTATDLLAFYGALTLMPADQLAQRVPQLLERVGLADRSREPIAQFSKGMVQRLGLAQALVNDPELLVLDEPTEGLDLGGRRLLREVVGELRGQGRTVLLISHALAEVEQLCDRIGVLVEGRLVHVGPIAELTTAAANGAGSFEAALQQIYAKAVP
jgi:ABC-2 type transport system ATP-binding protein